MVHFRMLFVDFLFVNLPVPSNSSPKPVHIQPIRQRVVLSSFQRRILSASSKISTRRLRVPLRLENSNLSNRIDLFVGWNSTISESQSPPKWWPLEITHGEILENEQELDVEMAKNLQGLGRRRISSDQQSKN